MDEYNKYLESQNKKKRGHHTLAISQEQYELSLTKLIVNAMLPLSFVALQWFKEYTHCK